MITVARFMLGKWKEGECLAVYSGDTVNVYELYAKSPVRKLPADNVLLGSASRTSYVGKVVKQRTKEGVVSHLVTSQRGEMVKVDGEWYSAMNFDELAI